MVSNNVHFLNGPGLRAPALDSAGMPGLILAAALYARPFIYGSISSAPEDGAAPSGAYLL